MDLLDSDIALRLAVFAHVARLRDLNGGAVPASALNAGLMVDGERMPIWNQQKGIFRPARMRSPGAALTVVTSVDSPYDDRLDDSDESRFVYRYRGTDPQHSDNIAVRRAMELRRPLLYLIGLEPGVYEPIFPVYVVGDRPGDLAFLLMADVMADISRALVEDPGELEARRAYRTVAAKVRVHQQQFRHLVLAAYRRQCAMCRLRHSPLLDAAHILPDRDERGRPEIPNGLSLCKIHHSAYDVGILGIDPDYQVHLREDILEEHDGPMLKHGLQEMHQQRLHVPAATVKRPNREYLAERFARFRAA